MLRLLLPLLLGFCSSLSAQERFNTNQSTPSAPDTPKLEVFAGQEHAGMRYVLLGNAMRPFIRFGKLDSSGGDSQALNSHERPGVLALNTKSVVLLGVMDGLAKVHWKVLPIGEQVRGNFGPGTAFVRVTRRRQSVPSGLSVEFPLPGSNVASSTIDVRGRIDGAMGLSPRLSVTVNGQAAIVTPGRPARFLLANQLLQPGSNSLSIVADDGFGRRRTQLLNVSLQRIFGNNVSLASGRAFVALGTSGFAIVDLESRISNGIPSPSGSGSVDDLALADGLLFVLDAAGAGSFSVYSLANPDAPIRVAGPRSVAVGPFTGISAAAGRVVISGGTSRLRVFSYGPNGALSAGSVSTDLGTGQPDVLLSSDGLLGFVSTDFASPFPQGRSFGITTLDIPAGPLSLATRDRIGLPGAGFSQGAFSPANFPIESAQLSTNRILTAHGGGLSLINTQNGTLIDTRNLGFAALQVDSFGSQAVVVGQSSLAEFDYTSFPPVSLGTRTLGGVGTIRAVALNGGYLVLATSSGGLQIESR